jgi:hypothetical protein
MFIPDPGSWLLPIPDPGSRISDPEYKKSNKREGWKKLELFLAINFTNSKIWGWDPGSEIRDA